MHRAALTILVASLLLSACGFSPFGCTDAGCESGVRFTLDHDLHLETEYRVTACVDDRCAGASLEVGPNSDGSKGPLSIAIGTDSDTVFYRLDQLAMLGEHGVSLTVHAADGELLVEWEGTAEFERTQPNGPLCEPTCLLADVRV